MNALTITPRPSLSDEQRAQYREDVEKLLGMKAKALKTGRKVDGYSLAQILDMVWIAEQLGGVSCAS